MRWGRPEYLHDVIKEVYFNYVTSYFFEWCFMKNISLTVLFAILLLLLSSCKTTEISKIENTKTQSETTVTYEINQNETPSFPTKTPIALPSNINFVIEPIFDHAEPFNAFGYAIVGIMTDGQMKYGIINESGDFMINPEFDSFRIPTWERNVRPEIDIGYIWLQKDGLWGFVDDQCEWVVECIYEDCLYFTDIGFAGVQVDGKWGFISTSGHMLVNPTYDWVEMCIENDYALICENFEWGMIDRNGNVIINPNYKSIFPDGNWSEFGRWSAAGHDIVLVNGNTALLSLEDEILVENAENRILSIGFNGLVFVDSSTDGRGYFNTNGDLVIPLQENEFGYVFAENGLAIVLTRNNDYTRSYRYINNHGDNVFDTEFDRAYNFTPNGVAAVVEDDKLGYIDQTGAYVIEPQFDSNWVWSFDDNGFVCVSKDGKWAIIDDNGNLITDFIYEDCEIFYPDEMSVSVFAACRDGQWGLVDALGQTILEHQFDYIISSYHYSMEGWNIINFSDADLAMTYKDGKYGVISLQGEILIDAESEEYFYVSENGYSVFSFNGKYGYVSIVN